MPRVKITVEAESGTRLLDEAVRDEAVRIGRQHADKHWTPEQASRAIIVGERSRHIYRTGRNAHHFRYESAD